MRSKLGIALLWVVVFLLGCVAGAVSHYLIVRDQLKAAAIPQRPRDIQGSLARLLNLDDQQKESLKSIFAQSRTKFTALNKEYKPKWDEFGEQVMKIRKEFDGEVKKILRPDQRTKFEEFLKKVYSQPPPAARPAQPAR